MLKRIAFSVAMYTETCRLLTRKSKSMLASLATEYLIDGSIHVLANYYFGQYYSNTYSVKIYHFEKYIFRK